jgi:hypothetical protein
VNTTSTQVIAISPRHSLTGPLASGTVLLTLTTSSGTCTWPYSYVLAAPAATACDADHFYPSPATGATGNFAYCMAQAGTARIRIYNVVGDLAANIEDVKAAGNQLSTVNTARLAPGVYLYRVEKIYGGSSTTSKVRKFVVRH